MRLKRLAGFESGLGNDLGHAPPRPPMDRVLLDRDDHGRREPRSPETAVDVERLHGWHVQHAAATCPAFLGRRRVERDLEGDARRHDQTRPCRARIEIARPISNGRSARLTIGSPPLPRRM